MSDRWKLIIKDLDHTPSILHAEPNPEIMTSFVLDAVKELTRRCALAEEQMIFRASPIDVLIRIRSFCDIEIARRSETKES